MQAVHMILTICSLIAAGIAVFGMVGARDALDKTIDQLRAAERHAGKFNAMAGRVVALEGAHESLLAQHRKLSGKFHAQAALNARHDEEAVEEVSERPTLSSPFCANYGQAQLEGPRSPAARCECGYCSEMRYRRDATKSALLPKTNSERHDAAKAGLEGRRYERE
jgi:hypothetical protein